ncbi:MAG: glycosyltransferase family 39 protein [bacterium]
MATLATLATRPGWDVVWVVGVAAALRLSGLDAVPWDHNQVEILKLVDPIVNQGAWPAVGWEISGRFGGSLPALLFWILALPRFVTRSPLALIAFGALFDVAAAGLTCLVARRLFGRVAGLVAGLLYAFDATLVAYSQTLWNLTMVPCFTALLLLGLVLVLVERRSWGVIPLLAALSALVQLHYVTAYFVPPVVSLLLIHRPRLRPAHVAIGVALALLGWAPYLAHEVRAGFPNLRAARDIAASVFTGSTPLEVDAVPNRFNAAVLARGATFRGVAFPSLPTRFLPAGVQPAWFVRALDELGVLLGTCAAAGALVLLGFVLQWLRSGRSAERAGRARGAALVLALYAVPLAVLALARFRLYDRYLLPLYPLPMILAVAPLALERVRSARRGARVALAALGALVLAAWCLVQMKVIGETRADARATGLVANDGTLGAKLEVARFFIEDIGLDAPAFARDTSFFSWPDVPAPDRHRGFLPLFSYLMDEVGVKRRLDRPRGPRYLVVYRGEQAQVVPELVTTEEYERERFSVVRFDEAVTMSYAFRASHVPEDWQRVGGHSSDWVISKFPLSWGGATALDESVAAQYLEVPFELHEPRAHGLFVIQTRECVEWVVLNGETLASNHCPPGRSRDELESTIHTYPLDDHWSVGPNVLRFKLVLRYSTASIDAYVLTLESSDRALRAPPEVARLARFVSPDPRRFRIAADVRPTGWLPVGLPMPHGPKMVEAFRTGPDTPATVRLAHAPWSLAAWETQFSLLSERAYWFVTMSPYPRSDFRGNWGLATELESSGRGGELRLVLHEHDGDEWRHADPVVLWEEGWKALAVPFAAFERDANQSAGDGRLSLAAIDAVMVQVVPGKTQTPLRDQTIRFTLPVLLEERPSQR